MKNKIIEFLRTKDYKFIREIGQGGTGRTVLLEDEIINERFVCKKYSPIDEDIQQLFFNHFKDEIKILHLINHTNIVRVFNYYLYPEKYTGYILMEYIEGKDIYSYLVDNPDKLNDLFIQIIDGFTHLEKCKILHRDIRPNNILISNDGIVKIIDFGFGKKTDFKEDFGKSISLNWRYTPPSDFKTEIYDYRTEIYFVGKLFEEIIIENNFQNFAYMDILRKMTSYSYDARIESFFSIQREIIAGNWDNISFSEDEKGVYLNFANSLSKIYAKIYTSAEYITDVEVIIKGLEQVYKNSMLETYIQNDNAIAKSFIKGNYSYYTRQDITVDTIKDFLNFIKSVSKDKQKLIVNNLWQRLDTVQREVDVEELPF